MWRIRLSDADRQTLGCPEWMDLDPGRLTLKEATELERMAIDSGQWAALLQRLSPEQKQPLTPSEQVLVEHCWAWMALRRAGIETDIVELDVDLRRMAVEFPESPGKAPSLEKPKRGGSRSRSPGRG